MKIAGDYQTPEFSLSVDGQHITALIQDRLISLTLTDNRGFEADQLDIVLDDSDGKLDLPPRGAEIRVALGWQNTGLVDKGSYTVDEVGHSGTPDTLTIRARSADLRAGLSTQRERSWNCSTVGLIVNTIAEENDLVPTVSAGLADQFVDHIDQTNESSANLLTRMAGLFDAIATVKNGRLLFIHAGAGITASGKRLPAVTITRQSGDSHNFNLADRNNYTLVKASYNDINRGIRDDVFFGKDEDDAEHNRTAKKAAETAQKAAETAAAVAIGKYKRVVKTSKNRVTAQRLARKEWQRISKSKQGRAQYIGVIAPYHDRNLATQGEVSYGDADVQKTRKNASKQAQKDAAKISAQTAPLAPAIAIDHSADNIKVMRHVYASRENAHKAARTEWRRLQRGMAEFSINLAHGQAELIPEMPATVQGFKPAIDNTDWMIIKVTHNLSDSGYTTQLALEIKATEIPG